jgi:hypothetical protein
MTASYMRAADEERKFRDRRVMEQQQAQEGNPVKAEDEDDPEYASYKEEKRNTQKMSQVLKSIQDSRVPPKKKRLASAQPYSQSAKHNACYS